MLGRPTPAEILAHKVSVRTFLALNADLTEWVADV